MPEPDQRSPGPFAPIAAFNRSSMDRAYRMLTGEAKRRRASVAAIIREAIDNLPADADRRRAAIAEVLTAEPMGHCRSTLPSCGATPTPPTTGRDDRPRHDHPGLNAVGTEHPLRIPCRRLLTADGEGRIEATTMIEVVQEFAHIRARRRERTDAVTLSRQYLSSFAVLAVTVDDLAARRYWSGTLRQALGD